MNTFPVLLLSIGHLRNNWQAMQRLTVQHREHRPVHCDGTASALITPQQPQHNLSRIARGCFILLLFATTSRTKVLESLSCMRGQSQQNMIIPRYVFVVRFCYRVPSKCGKQLGNGGHARAPATAAQHTIALGRFFVFRVC